MRKISGVILVALLLIIAVSGCSSKDKKEIKADNKLSKGKYVEENIVLPEGIAPNEFVSITASPNGEIELYAYHNASYAKYLYINKKWDMGKAVASMKSNAFDPNNFTIQKIFYGEDKRQYLYGDNVTENKSELYRLSDAGVFEKVELKRFDDTYKEWDNLPYRPKEMKVLENGMIVAVYLWGVIEVYSPDGQSMIDDYNCGSSCVLATEGNTLYYVDQNDKEILSTNLETKKKGSPRALDIDLDQTGILELHNGTAYVCNSSGINLNVKGASLWETVLDGGQSSLSMPSERLKDFEIATEEEYFIVLSNLYNSEVSIKHIFYDKNASSAPPMELSIFSIEDNLSIRQAIILFQEKHPDVRINFRIANTDDEKYSCGVKNPKQTITLKDQINALNTELLAGKGADILVLDGMSIESYIDKGVLEDMGSVFSSMKASGELVPNIADPYYTDGKVYTMPIRFRLPIIYGTSNAVNAANSITELSEYARNNSKERPLFVPSNYRAMAAWLFLTYYDQILGQDNEIDEAALQDFLKKLDIISEEIHASDDARMSGKTKRYGHLFGYWVGCAYQVYEKKCQCNIEEIDRMMEIAIPVKTAQTVQGTFKVINHRFKANGLIGINSAGNQKELAKEFIQLLFSKKIQGLDLGDGFPVNKIAMDELIQKDVNNFAMTGFITADYPDLKLRKKIYESICALDKPMVNDMTMLDMILDEAEKYLRGDITAEQAASNAVASIHLYRSE